MREPYAEVWTRFADTFGRAVRDRRSERGMSQTELADMVGVSRQNIVSIESAKNSPGFWALLAVAEALEIDLSELYGMYYSAKKEINMRR